MHPRTRELLDYLDTERAALREAIDRVPVERRGERPAVNRWSVAEVLEHLTLVERRVAQVVTDRIEAGKAEGLGVDSETSAILPTLDLPRVLDRNQLLIARAEDQPVGGIDEPTAWAALEGERATLRTALLSSDGLALGTLMQPHPRLGVLNVYQWIAFVGAHEARHRVQIDEVADAFSTATG